jgi:hypothetical protein
MVQENTAKFIEVTYVGHFRCRFSVTLLQDCCKLKYCYRSVDYKNTFPFKISNMSHILQMIWQRGMRQGRVERGEVHLTCQRLEGTWLVFRDSLNFVWPKLKVMGKIWICVWCIYGGELWFGAKLNYLVSQMTLEVFGLLEKFTWKFSRGGSWLWSWHCVGRLLFFCTGVYLLTLYLDLKITLMNIVWKLLNSSDEHFDKIVE